MNLGLLLVAYKRSDNLRAILDPAYASGLREFFVTIDGLKVNHSEVDTFKQNEVLRILRAWKQEHPDCNVRIKCSQINFGCSATVLHGVDWISKSVNQFCILEDDCIPSLDFFTYIKDGLRVIEKHQDIMLVSGSQFAPKSITKDCWHLSHYALTWGWATSSSKWNVMRNLIKFGGVNQKKSNWSRELSYWRAGSRRAELGYVDVWDTIIVKVLIELGLYSLLPGSNLVVNVGFDAEATHTKDDSTWLNRPLGRYMKCKEPKHNQSVDLWLSDYFYKIRNRHIITTRLTRVLDVIGVNKKRVAPLYERWP